MHFNTIFTGKNFIELDSVESTNNYATNLVNKTNVSNVPDGTVIMAHYQFSGRGQMGNHWDSEPGKNLLTSIIYKPTFINGRNHFYISKIASLAVQSVLQAVVEEEVQIKWPNDIYIGSKKIAGMLIENEWSGKNVTTIIGIGININQTFFGTNTNATSCQLETHKEQDVRRILGELASALEYFYLKLRNNNLQEITDLYLEHLLYFNQLKTFRVNGNLVTGTIIDVKNTGELEVRMTSGTTSFFQFKEIEFVID